MEDNPYSLLGQKVTYKGTEYYVVKASEDGNYVLKGVSDGLEQFVTEKQWKQFGNISITKDKMIRCANCGSNVKADDFQSHMGLHLAMNDHKQKAQESDKTTNFNWIEEFNSDLRKSGLSEITKPLPSDSMESCMSKVKEEHSDWSQDQKVAACLNATGQSKKGVMSTIREVAAQTANEAVGGNVFQPKKETKPKTKGSKEFAKCPYCGGTDVREHNENGVKHWSCPDCEQGWSKKKNFEEEHGFSDEESKKRAREQNAKITKDFAETGLHTGTTRSPQDIPISDYPLQHGDQVCPRCSGKGTVTEQTDGSGIPSLAPCRDCNGSGKFVSRDLGKTGASYTDFNWS